MTEPSLSSVRRIYTACVPVRASFTAFQLLIISKEHLRSTSFTLRDNVKGGVSRCVIEGSVGGEEGRMSLLMKMEAVMMVLMNPCE